MPTLPHVRRPRRVRRAARASRPPRVVVVGDLVLDVTLVPARTLVSGTDVPGRVSLRQGGSAANTARWLGRLGARATLVSAVGRDPVGRALVDVVQADGVTTRVIRIPSRPTGRIGVLVAPGGERSFIADRGAADELRPEDLKPAWFRAADAVHLPAYSLLGDPLGLAGRAAIELGRAEGAAISLDLASMGPLLAKGRRAAVELVRSVRADVLFATAAEAEALLGRYAIERLLDYAPLAVVKRGPAGATILGRGLPPQDVATTAVAAADTTGAGDAFDAGFLVAWLVARRLGRTPPSVLHRATLAGHRAAARHLTAEHPELPLG